MEVGKNSLFEGFIKEASGSQFVIPVYQRKYTWRKNKDVKQLLSDVEAILNKERERHFVGTIVFSIIKTSFIVRERSIVDGQQRLITMFLIAYALREIANTIGRTDLVQYLSNYYLENRIDSDIECRMRTSVSDDNAFELIAKGKQSEFVDNNDSTVMTNFKYIKSEMERLVNSYGIEAVLNAVRQIYIVWIQLGDTDDAQQIFESINSRGEPLSAADLIRNFILMNRLNTEQEIIYSDYWLKLENIFPDTKKMAEYFRLYLATKQFVLITEKELYSEFKKHWKGQLDGKSYNDILDDILNYAYHFKRLYLDDKTDRIGTALLDYRKMQSLMPAPFAMKIFEYLRTGRINEQQAGNILQLLNTYLVRRYIAGQDTSAISRFFPGFLKNVDTAFSKNSADKLLDICIYYLVNDTRIKSSFMPDDTQVINYLNTANAYVLSNIRWILEKLETNDNPINVDMSGLSIEHIMPQTSSDYWNGITNLPADEYESIVNRLGNLTLAAIPDNSKMSNKDFDSKKEILKTTAHLKLNSELFSKTKWTVDEIKKRTESLSKRILNMFPYQTTKWNPDDDPTRYISLNRGKISAIGYLHPDESLTVYAGSNIRIQTQPSSETLRELREELLEKEEIVIENGICSFTRDFKFGSPSQATDFIFGGSNNGWDYWKDSNGVIINDCLRGKA
jgi:uncharacterized protein with ParB-like and HNH nuclease domain